MDDLLCPACRIPLRKTETPRGVIWRCEKCDGRAVGLALLREMFTAESINPIWLHAIHNEGAAGRACPSCARAMIGVPLATDTEVTVEVCRLCQMIWFDRGEVASLQPKPLPARVAAPLSAAARQAIAIAHVQAMSEQASRPDYQTGTAYELWRTIFWLVRNL